MLAAYSIRRSSVVLNPRARVLAGLGTLGDDGGGGGDGGGDAGGAASGESGLDAGAGVYSGGGEVGNSGVTVGTLGVVDVVATAISSVNDAADAVAIADLDLGAAMSAAANKAATDKTAAAVITKGINLGLSKTGPLGAALALVLSATGLTSAAVNAGMNGNSTASSAAINSAVDSVVGAVDVVNANPNLPQAVKTTVMTVANSTQTVNSVLQANNFDLRSLAYKRFLLENGGKGIPALYQEIRDFISTHNKAEIDQAMQASGVSNADVIAAFQAVGTSQPGSGTNLAFLAAVAASYFILGA